MISPWELLVYLTRFQYFISETKKKQYKYAIKKKPAGGEMTGTMKLFSSPTNGILTNFLKTAYCKVISEIFPV